MNPRPTIQSLTVCLVFGRHRIKRVVVDRALAEVPRPLGQLRLLDDLEDAAVALLVPDLELQVLVLLAHQLAAQSLGQEERVLAGTPARTWWCHRRRGSRARRGRRTPSYGSRESGSGSPINA